MPGHGHGDHLLARPPALPEGARCQLLVGHYDTIWPVGTIRDLGLVPAVTPLVFMNSDEEVGSFKLRIRGIAAHAGAEPEKGASAVLELAHVVQRLHSLNDPERGALLALLLLGPALQA